MENENNNDPVDQANKASGDDGSANKDSVSHESFLKVVGEKKKVQERASSMEAELQTLREEKLKREGKTTELLTAKEQRIQELESRISKSEKAYAWKTLTGEIKREASKAGCTNPDKLIRLMDDEDLSSINVGEDFSIDGDSLKRVIEKNKKDNSFLFSSSSKKIVNGNPGTGEIVANETDLSKLSLDEIKALHKKNANK
jgi:hypothetical protein